MICCPIVGNHSDIRRYQFHAKYVANKFSQSIFFSKRIKLHQIKDILHGRERNPLKTLEQVTPVVYFRVVHVTLFRMHEIVTTTEGEFDAVLKMIQRACLSSEIQTKH